MQDRYSTKFSEGFSVLTFFQCSQFQNWHWDVRQSFHNFSLAPSARPKGRVGRPGPGGGGCYFMTCHAQSWTERFSPEFSQLTLLSTITPANSPRPMKSAVSLADCVHGGWWLSMARASKLPASCPVSLEQRQWRRLDLCCNKNRPISKGLLCCKFLAIPECTQKTVSSAGANTQSGICYLGDKPHSPNLFDLADCVILCTLWLQSPGKVYSVQNIRDNGEMPSKDRCKTTSGFFVIPLLSQLWEEKNYCEWRNELSSWRPVALPNRHIHLCLFKLGYDVLALLSGDRYILSGENLASVYSTIRRRRDQNTTQVDTRQGRARTLYVQLLHLSSMTLVDSCCLSVFTVAG